MWESSLKQRLLFRSCSCYLICRELPAPSYRPFAMTTWVFSGIYKTVWVASVFCIVTQTLICRWKPAWVGSSEEPEETAGATEAEGLQWQGVKQGTDIGAAQTEACILKESNLLWCKAELKGTCLLLKRAGFLDSGLIIFIIIGSRLGSFPLEERFGTYRPHAAHQCILCGSHVFL